MKKVKSLIIALMLFVTSSIAVFTIVGCSGGSKPNGDDPNNAAKPEKIIDGNFVYTLLDDDSYSIQRYGNEEISGELIIPSTYNGKTVSAIGENAFMFCSKITSITIPDSIKKIEKDAFYMCRIENVTAPAFACNSFSFHVKHLNITSGNIDDTTLQNFSFLTELTLTETINSITTNALKDFSIETAKIPISLCSYIRKAKAKNIIITSGETIVDYAFKDCSSLESITFPDSISKIGELAFDGCSSIKKIIIPDSVNEICGSAFSNCTSLEEIVLPKNCSFLESFLFKNCSSLKTITFPDDLITLKRGVFADCSSLTNIVLPSTLKTIGLEAFSGCSSLTDITIPTSVTYIDDFVFSKCPKLTTIHYLGTSAQWKSIQKGLNAKPTSATLICTDDDQQ